MKRTIIFPTVFTFMILGLNGIAENVQMNRKTDNQNIIKAHIQRTPCNGYYVTYTRIGGGYQETTGPTGQECTTGTLGSSTAGYYKVEAYDGCHNGFVNYVWHPGYGFTDVYISPTDPCQ